MTATSRTKTVADGQPVSLETRYEETVEVTPAVALVHVHTSEPYEGPDSLVLRSEDGEAKSDRTYWRELTIRDQTHAQTRVECAFTIDDHQGSAVKKEELEDLTFQLAWRPAGAAEDEILLFENQPTRRVWNLDGLLGSPVEERVMAHLGVFRFQECSGLSFPGEGGLNVELPDQLREVYEPLPEEEGGPFPAPDQESGVPVQSRSSSEASESEASKEEEGSIPGASVPEAAPPEGDRWIALYGQISPETDTLDSRPFLLGAYRATTDGSYKRASLNGDSPSPDGPAQDDVLLPIGCVGAGPIGIFARLMLGTPSTDRLEQGTALLQKGKVQESLLPATTPLFVNQSSDGQLPEVQDTGPQPGSAAGILSARAESHVRCSDSGPGRVLFLTNALWVAERRIRAAEAANEHIQEWSKQAGWAGGPSDFVGGLCYDPVHDRQYLNENLADAPITIDPDDTSDRAHYHVDPDYNMETTWAPFSPEQVNTRVEGSVREKAAHHELGQYLYGYRCKQAFLTWNRDRAARRAQTLLGSSILYQCVLDLYASPASADELSPFLDHLFDLFPRLLLAGGFPPLPHAREGALTGRTNTGDEYLSLQELTGRSFLCVLIQLGLKTDTALYPLVFACAPIVLSQGDEESAGGPPTGLKRFARFLMWTAYGEDVDLTHTEDGDYRLYDDNPQNADVVLTQKSGEAGDVLRRPWQLELSGRVKSELEARTESLFPDTERITAIHMLNGFLAGQGAMDYLSSEPFGFDDASAAAKLLVKVPALVDEGTSYSDIIDGQMPGWVGEFLLRVGPGLDVLTGARDFGQAVFDTDPRGQAVARDPNYLSMAGAVLSTAGGIALTVGSGPVAVGGAIGVLIGGAAQWLNEIEDRLDVEAADPLNGWLASNYVWGNAFEDQGTRQSRDALFDTVRPDPDLRSDPTTKSLGTTPLPGAVSEQTKALTERAFYFPTGVGVGTPEDGSSPQGLQLDIAIGYLPVRGTLMVNANVEAPGMPPAPVRCAVHYLQTATSLRYCVCPSSTRLDLPRQHDVDLSNWVEEMQWAWARTDELELSTGERVSASHLEIHIGQWPTRFDSREREETATYAERMHVEKRMPIAAAIYEGLGSAMGQDMDANRRDKELMENYRRAKEVRRTVAPRSHLSGSRQLSRILEGGDFQITGAVFFDPLRSFCSRPRIPDSRRASDDRVIAREPIRFRYS